MKLETCDVGTYLSGAGDVEQIILGYRDDCGNLHHFHRDGHKITGFVLPSAWQPVQCTR